MNAQPLPADRRAVNQQHPAPRVLWMPPETTDPEFPRWYEAQECLDHTNEEIWK